MSVQPRLVSELVSNLIVSEQPSAEDGYLACRYSATRSSSSMAISGAPSFISLGSALHALDYFTLSNDGLDAAKAEAKFWQGVSAY